MVEGALAPLTARLTGQGVAGSDIRPWLPSLIGAPAWAVIAAGLGVLGLMLWRLPAGPATRGYWRWLPSGAALGALGVLAWLTGAHAEWHWGLSITGPSRSLLEAGLLNRPDTLNWGVAMLVGLPLGSWASARLRGPISWRAPTAQGLPRRFLGGLLMGIGGTLAGGCNIGNALTGLSVLAVHSVIATIAMAGGVAVGVSAFERRAE